MNNKIVLGTVQMGLPYGINNISGKASVSQSHEILSYAFKSGIRYLDTAEAYGDAHKVIGHFHREHPDKKFNIITKIPSGGSLKDMDVKIHQYLNDLEVDSLNTLMFHSFSSYKRGFDNLKELKNSGLFLKLGASVYTNDEVDEVINNPGIDIVQFPFNLLDNYSYRGNILLKAKRMNKLIQTRSVFLQGLFFKNPNEDHHLVTSLKDELNSIYKLSVQENVSIDTLALSYCLSQPLIDQIVIGVDSIQHLINNLEAAKYKIRSEVITQINSISTKNLKLLNPSIWN